MNPSQQQPALMHTLNELKDGTHERRNVTGVVIEACSVPDGGGKGCPLAPVNTRGFTSLYHLWEQLAGASPSSPNCSFMEAEARGVEWRRDSPPSSRRRKFWFKRKRLHAWVTGAVGKGCFATAKDALDCLEGWRKKENIGLGTLLMMVETQKVPSPAALATRGVPTVV